MNDVVKFATAGLPAVTTLSTALRSLERDAGPTGVAIIKMDKTGHWVFGKDQTEVEDDATWAVNPFSFVHGLVAWGEGELLGEAMVPVSAPLPEVPPAPVGAKRGWETQVGCSLKCLSGEDEGMEMRFSTSSTGGKRAVQTLAGLIAAQVDKDQTKPVPVVLLKKDHYMHKSWGKVFTPVFEVVKWISMTGESEPEKAPEPAAEPEAPTRRRRRV
jgi:hypothetical protein